MSEYLTFWPLALAAGLGVLGLAALVALAAFALWLEDYTRNYREVGGPPWERRGRMNSPQKSSGARR